jgi:hypothetical protein
MVELVAPPPYATPGLTLTDLSTLLEKSDFEWTTEKKLAFSKEVITRLNSEDIQKKFVDEVNSLSDKSKIIRDGFAGGSTKFQELYDQKLSDRFKGQVKQFQNDWKGYSDVRIVYRSHIEN